MAIDYSSDFLAFFRDVYRVEGKHGPHPLVPDFLGEFLGLAFKDGQPAARNIMDCRSKKEGKSALAGAVALYMASRESYSEVVIAAADKDQAKDRVLRAVKFACENGPLNKHAKIYRDVIELDHKSIITAIPMDYRGAAGGNYSCVIFDELWAWIYEGQNRLFDELIPPPTQPFGLRWIASYAGFLGESELLKTWWDRGLEGERISELPIYYNQGANLLSFIDTGIESWRMPWMTPAYMTETKATERPNTWQRLWLNEWVNAESAFIPREFWEACYSPDVIPLAVKDDRRRLTLGVDASTTRDLTALVGCWNNNKTKKTEVIYVKTYKPQRGFLRMGKPTIDLEAVRDEILRLHKNGQIEIVLYDPYQLHSVAIELERAGVRIKEFPQTTQRVEADQGLYDAIIGQQIQHFNHQELNQHIYNAIAVEGVRGFRLTKEKTSLKIDLAVALSMAVFGAKEFYTGVMHTFPSFWDLKSDYCCYTIDSICQAFVVHREAPEVHRPGVTHENCRWRNQGCPACIDEYEAEGYFKEDDFFADPDIIYTSVHERGIQQRRMITEADQMQARARNAFLSGIEAGLNNK